jgi:hypothetical protein
MQFRAHWEARLDRLDAALERRKSALIASKKRKSTRSS